MNHQVLGDVSPENFKCLIEYLKVPLPVNEYRLKSGIGRSQCFGVVKQRNGHYHGSRMNHYRPEVYRELQKISKLLPEGFTFDGIQLNQNYQTAPHKDVGNRGNSIIIGFGDYQGGHLLIEETSVDIKNKLVAFDGSIYTHSTAPYTGDRYSIVFFSVKRHFKIKPEYEVIDYDKKLYLKEKMYGVERWYGKNGDCIWATDGIVPQKRAGQPILDRCEEF